MTDFLKSIDFTALVDSIMDNIVWICVGLAAFFALLLGGGLFKDKRRWIWRSVLVAVVCVATLIFTNFQFYYDAYTDGDELGSASRFLIGNTDPKTAKAIEFLMIGVEDVDHWDGSGRFLSWEKEYENETGKATMVKYLFNSTLEIETQDVVWRANCVFGRVSAEITYKNGQTGS